MTMYVRSMLTTFSSNLRLRCGYAYVCLRNVSSVREFASNRDSLSIVGVRSFAEIPGPKSFPIVGTLLNYFPVLGSYTFDRLHRNGMLKLREFGPLVREEILPGENILWVFTPHDIETVYRAEGRYPRRRSHLALQKYRNDKPYIYSSGGILPTYGKEWLALRSAFQKPLNHIQSVEFYIEDANTVLDAFMKILKKREDFRYTDITPYLSHLFLELISLFAFDKGLESLSESGLELDSLASILIEAAQTVNGCTVSLDNSFLLWRYFDTPLYMKFKKAHETIERVSIDLVYKKKSYIDKHGISERKQRSILEHYLSDRSLNVKDIVGMTVDMILGGMDTTSFSSSFVLYHLAINPDCQEILYKECRDLLPEKNTPITRDIIRNARYTKAVLKESLRLYPVSVGVGRILAHDVVLSGYHVPKGTNVVTQNQVTCRLEEYFPEPNKFIPERWIETSTQYRKPPNFLVLPFGYGPRSCIARRFAEQNIRMLILKLFRNFQVTWCGGTLDCISLPNKPDHPVLLSFQERED